jgi:2-octaprenyl-6-methoxyphenol hydroxylase
MIDSAVSANPSKPALPHLDYDVAIVGGGIVGVTLAAALKYSGLQVVIIEAQPQSEAITKGQAYAIHLSSQRIWQAIGVWAAIEPHIQPFRRVQMSDADYPHRVTFELADLKTEALGYVAEHRVLLKKLRIFVNACSNVTWRCPAQVVAQRDRVTYTEIDLQSVPDTASVQTLRVRLVVGADGSTSQVRQQSQIKTRGKAYWQSCIVATIQPEQSHNYTAYERFWPSGPFAILPISETHCRIVWTAPHAEAKALLLLDEATFIEQLTKRYGQQMGELTLVGPRFVFPAKLMHACEYVRSHIALVGDAAHSCHPVGGQGLNLGIRDVWALAQILNQAHARGEDIGTLAVLKRYQRWRRWQNMLSLRFTDSINLMFSNNCLPLVLLRRLGLRLMSRIQFLRRVALQFMAGLSDKTAVLGKGKYPDPQNTAKHAWWK